MFIPGHTTPPTAYPRWRHTVDRYLLHYGGRSLADLPHRVEYWLVWAWARCHRAQEAGMTLAVIDWGPRVTMVREWAAPQRQPVRVLRALQERMPVIEDRRA